MNSIHSNNHLTVSSINNQKSASTAKPEQIESMNTVVSFTYGVIGLDLPETVTKGDEDPCYSYTAGQCVKGAIAVGSILLAIV